MHIYAKQCVKYEHLSRNPLKIGCFKLWDGENTQKNIFKVAKSYGISQHWQLLSQKPSQCVIVLKSEFLKKTQRGSTRNWSIKNYWPGISLYHSEIVTKEKKIFQMTHNL